MTVFVFKTPRVFLKESWSPGNMVASICVLRSASWFLRGFISAWAYGIYFLRGAQTEMEGVVAWIHRCFCRTGESGRLDCHPENASIFAHFSDVLDF